MRHAMPLFAITLVLSTLMITQAVLTRSIGDPSAAMNEVATVMRLVAPLYAKILRSRRKDVRTQKAIAIAILSLLNGFRLLYVPVTII